MHYHPPMKVDLSHQGHIEDGNLCRLSTMDRRAHSQLDIPVLQKAFVIWTKIACIWTFFHRTYRRISVCNDRIFITMCFNVLKYSLLFHLAQKYPVMIYIHGGNDSMIYVIDILFNLYWFIHWFIYWFIHEGDFIHGASNTFQPHVMVSFYKVVVVTINYRLGALGFLSTADDNSPGNYGILDQVMAIKWIYDNIEFFNGDRQSITLFGPGAGAASAGLLMVTKIRLMTFNFPTRRV